MSVAEPRAAEPPTGRARAASRTGPGPRPVTSGIGPCLQRLDDAIAAAAALGIPTDDAEHDRARGGRSGSGSRPRRTSWPSSAGPASASRACSTPSPGPRSATPRPAGRRPRSPLAWVPRASRADLAGLLDWLGVRRRTSATTAQRRSGTSRSSTCPTSIRSRPPIASGSRRSCPRVDAVVVGHRSREVPRRRPARRLPRRLAAAAGSPDRRAEQDRPAGGRRRRAGPARSRARPGPDGRPRRPGQAGPRAADLGADGRPAGRSSRCATGSAAIEAKRVVRAHVVTAIGAAVTALARAAGVDPTARATPLVDGASRRRTSDRRHRRAAPRRRPARGRAPGRGGDAGPRPCPRRRPARRASRRASIAGRVARRASPIPAAFLARWRERGSLAPALEVLRGALDAPLREAPPATRATLATSVEPAALGTNLARAVDRAIAARAVGRAVEPGLDAHRPAPDPRHARAHLQRGLGGAVGLRQVPGRFGRAAGPRPGADAVPRAGGVAAGRVPDRPAAGRPCRLGSVVAGRAPWLARFASASGARSRPRRSRRSIGSRRRGGRCGTRPAAPARTARRDAR